MSKVTLKIPRQLYDRLNQIIDGTGFNSVTEFAVYVLRDIASSPMATSLPDQEDNHSRLNDKEIAAIRQRLRNLGYLE